MIRWPKVVAFLVPILLGDEATAADCGEPLCITTTDEGGSGSDGSSSDWPIPPPGTNTALSPTASPGGNVARRMCGALEIDVDEDFDQVLEDLPEVTALTESEAAASGAEIGTSADRNFSSTLITEATTTAQQAGAAVAAAATSNPGPSPMVVPRFSSDADTVLPGTMGMGVDDGARTQEETGSDPVDPGTSEFVLRRQDLFLPGIGIDVSFVRTYRNRWTYNGSLGHGWTHPYEQRLVSSTGACNLAVVTWSTGTGSALRFAQQSDGTYRATPEAHAGARGSCKHLLSPSPTKATRLRCASDEFRNFLD